MKQTYSRYFPNRLKNSHWEFIKFVISGGLSALLEMFLLILFVEHFKIGYLIANSISFIVTNIFNYLLSRYWVFGKSDRIIHIEASLFFTIVGIGLTINQLIMWYFVDVLHYNYKFSKVIAMILVVAWNFIGKKFFVFKSVKFKHA